MNPWLLIALRTSPVSGPLCGYDNVYGAMNIYIGTLLLNTPKYEHCFSKLGWLKIFAGNTSVTSTYIVLENRIHRYLDR